MIVLLLAVFFLSFLIGFYLVLHFWLHDFSVPRRLDFFPQSKKKKKKIMAIFPHPDDETCVAATLAYLSPLPNTITVLLTLTRGGEGYWGKQRFSRAELKTIREKELKRASKKLKIDKLIVLDYPDMALDKISKERLKKIVLRYLKRERPNLVLTYDEKGGLTGHQDHIWSSQAVTEAVREVKKQWPIRLYWVVLPQKVNQIIEKATKKKLTTLRPEFCLSFPRLGLDGIRALQRRYLAFTCHQSQFTLFRPQMGIPFWLANLIMHRDYYYWKRL